MSKANNLNVRLQLPTVFLCGPITGVSLINARNWRHLVSEALAGAALTIDPTRDSPDTIRRSQEAAGQAMTVHRLINGKQTVARNRFDIRRADLVLASFLGAKSVSIGSVGEIFWADALGKTVIIVREENNPHNHDMLNELAGWIFADLDAAIEQIRRLIRHDGTIETSSQT